MIKMSLTFKITIAFIVVSMTTLTFIYFVFNNLFQERMLKSEEEKAVLIAQTIEPMIGMSYYLGLTDDIIQLSEQTMKSDVVEAITITINKKDIFHVVDTYEENQIDVTYPIKDPVTQEEIGSILVCYKLDNFYSAFEEIKVKILNYLVLLGGVFLAFGLMTRYLLNPLGQIEKKVKNYKPGSVIDFSTIREELETNAIVNAFKSMLNNIREHTSLLERYKYALDESAIVSKTNPNGEITYVNSEFCRVSGYGVNELIGSPHNIVGHKDMHTNTFTNMWEVLNNKLPWKGTLKNQAKTGMPYYVKVTIVPIFNDNDETVEYISIQHDITQIIQQQEQIARQTTELITGLPNRVKLEEDIENIMKPKFALIDLNNYNIIKEYYGHDILNYTLKETAEMLKEYVSDNNMTMYKLTSGEFGILANDNMDIAIFNDICSHILQKIDDYIVYVGDDSFNIQATAGLTYSKLNTIANASLALRQAIDTKKESIVFEDTDNLIKGYENNIEWTKRLKSAFDEDRIIVYVQPIVDAKTLKTDKYECLVRMVCDEGSIISPFYFLDIAKKSKLYHTLTQRVIISAFDIFSKLPDKTFSINLSVEDLTYTPTMDFLKGKIKEYDIASRVVLEIVESEGIDNFDEIIPLISEFKNLGCKISIDDFGTGYSNFAYLMQLNVDYIKIDGSLIKDIDHNQNSQIISKTILDFAKQLELKTVAEYIHNEEVMQYTQELGIDYLKGFNLGIPVPIDSFLE